MTAEDRRKRIQRWIGSPQTGDLNDAETVEELEEDVIGLKLYLAEKKESTPLLSGRTFKNVKHTTPNMGSTIIPRGVVFHHSAGSFVGSLSWIKQARSKVSYNVIVEEDGTRHTVVPINRRAWHAGRSEFKGRSGCNGFMVGFAFSGSTYERELTDEEIASALEFVTINAPKYGWTYEWMTDHRITSPGRKNDLREEEWDRLKSALRHAF